MLSLPLPPLTVLLLSVPAAAQGGGWTAYHDRAGAAAGDLYGTSVALLGDLDGDRCVDWIVGAPGASPGGVQFAGSVELRSGRDGGLIRRHDGALTFGTQGMGVGAAGDLDGDGVEDYLYVVPGENGPGQPAWSGVLSARSGVSGALLWQAFGTTAGGDLGLRIAAAPDWSGDGVPELIVSERFAALPGQSANGCLHVFSGADGSTLYQQWGAPQDELGDSLGVLADVDGDGVDDYFAGAPFAGGGSGEVRVFPGGPAAAPPLRTLVPAPGGASYGYTAAAAGDVDGDGAGDLAVVDYVGEGVETWSGATGVLLRRYRAPAGASLGNTFALAGGADYDQDGRAELVVPVWNGVTELRVLDGRDGVEMAALAPPPGASSYYGFALSTGRDATGDGIPDLLVADF